MKRFVEALLDLVFPRRCVFCDKIVLSGDLCEDCGQSVESVHELRHLALPDGGEVLCVAPYRYEGIVRDGILRFKFQGQRQYAACFGELLANEIVHAEALSGVDAVTAVPASKARLRGRGYNQAALLARRTAQVLGLPYEELLSKAVNNKQQHFLPKAERLLNVKGVYALLAGGDCNGKTLLLVDDIVTTGSTLAECALVLLMGGARAVVCATLAEAEVSG